MLQHKIFIFVKDFYFFFFQRYLLEDLFMALMIMGGSSKKTVSYSTSLSLVSPGINILNYYIIAENCP